MNEWKTGDVITAERLNGMQNKVLIVNLLYDDSLGKNYIDKSYNEIKSALQNGYIVYVYADSSEENYVEVHYSIVSGITEMTVGNNQIKYKVTSGIVVCESNDPNEYMYRV